MGALGAPTRAGAALVSMLVGRGSVITMFNIRKLVQNTSKSTREGGLTKNLKDAQLEPCDFLGRHPGILPRGSLGGVSFSKPFARSDSEATLISSNAIFH